MADRPQRPRVIASRRLARIARPMTSSAKQSSSRLNWIASLLRSSQWRISST